MANPYQRCSRYWKKDNPPVQCERWDGHTWRHSAFDHDGLLLEWGGVEAPKRNGSYLLPGFGDDGLPLQGDEHVPWNQPVSNNLEVDETVTAEDHRADDEQVLRIELQQWKDRCLIAERSRDQHYRSWQNAEQQRDEAQKELLDALDALRKIRALTFGE